MRGVSFQRLPATLLNKILFHSIFSDTPPVVLKREGNKHGKHSVPPSLGAEMTVVNKDSDDSR